MPLITISMFKGKSVEFKKKLNDEIHGALVQCFKIKEGDYNQKTREYAPADWTIPEGRSDQYVLVEMCVFPGRARETKKKLYAEIVNRLVAMGIPKDDVFIMLVEQPMENWSFRGGLPADEIDLGYSRNV
jgi:phenylpyruvate tautomerase PptA (4-oxalocrotonate tautomerase family)